MNFNNFQIKIVVTVAILMIGVFTVAYAAFNPQINYQGKLTDTNDVAVADGDYNFEFKLYTTSTGGSATWTETCTSSDRITVTYGLFSHLLGSVNSLSGVDFNQTLWLGVNIGGTTTTEPLPWDGEMTPRKKLGAVPAAFEADKLDGIDSSQFLRSDAADTMSASSSSAILTVQQDGSGNIVDFKVGASSKFVIDNTGSVGIGTTSPAGKLQVQDGAVLFSGTTGSTPVSGAGTRLMWIPAKAAFRVGYVDSTQWDDANIGSYSFASGDSTNASGTMSTAMGSWTTASGYASIAMGYDTIASGYTSVAIGAHTTASGESSTAMGAGTTASGESSTAMGADTTASGIYSTAIGVDTTASGNYGSIAMGRSIIVAGDYSFGIGLAYNATPPTITQNNVMAIMGGNVGIGTTSPSTLLHVYGTSTLHNVLPQTTNTYTLGSETYKWANIYAATTTIGDTITIGTDSISANSTLTISTDNSAHLILSPSGNVGIGTTSPGAKLYIKTQDLTTVPFQTEGLIQLLGNYRIPITIDNTQNSNTLTDYQVLMTVDTQSLISAGKMRLDCGDIRFTDSDGSTLLNYWIGSGCNSTTTKIWVKVPNIPASSTKTIYIYYGNPEAASGSDRNGTFPNSYITSGGATLGGVQNYDWFEVQSGANLYILADNLLTINARYIKISGTINGVGKGYSGQKTSPGEGYGPGKGLYNGGNGGGAGYGGQGGCAPAGGAGSCGTARSASYGTSAGDDIDKGSGGAMGASGYADNAGGNGGGAVILQLQGRYVEVTGVINNDGENGAASYNSSSGGGGGSGGGILIKGADLNLSGAQLFARGGKAGNRYGGSGGGGRIKVFYSNSLTGTYSTDVSTYDTCAYDGVTLLLGDAVGLAGTTYQGTFSSSESTTTLGSEEIVPPTQQTETVFYIQPGSGNVGIGTTGPQQKLTLSSGSNFAIEMGYPTGVGTATTTGGTLPAGTYYFKVVASVVASDGLGTTIGSSEVSRTIAAGEAIVISWSGTTGASSYRVYGNTSGTQDHYFTTPSTSYIYSTSTGSTAGTVPTVTTAHVNKLTASGDSWLLGGNVGIGTIIPQGILSVNKSGSIIDEYTESLTTHVFTGGGVAQNWNADDESWTYTLPFSFPFYNTSGGTNYTSIKISSDGTIGFTDSGNVNWYKQWEAKAYVPSGIMAAGSGVINGKIYITGAMDDNWDITDTLYIYDTQTDEWATGTPMTTLRGTPIAGVINDKLYVAGGRDADNWYATTTLEVYDPISNTWGTSTPMSDARTAPAGGAYDNMLYAVGGMSGDWTVVQTLEVYDPNTLLWVTKEPPPVQKLGGSTASFLNGKMYVMGGHTDGSTPYSDILLIYDIGLDEWATGTPMPAACVGGSSVIFNGKILYIGGNDTDTIFVYDPDTETWDTWTNLPLPEPIHRATTQVIGTTSLYVIGGRSDWWDALATTYLLTVVEGSINTYTGFPFIAPLGMDLKTDGTGQANEDIYITENSDNVIIRWQAEEYLTNNPINFEVILYDNGDIKFNYGDQPTPPTSLKAVVGISKGDEITYMASAYNGNTTFDNVQSSFWTRTPARPVGTLFNLQSDGSNIFQVTDNSFSLLGNVGIGIDNPDAKLDISGSARIYDQNARTGVSTLTIIAGEGQATSPLFQWQNNAGKGLGVIDASGMIGIGTAVPQQKLTLSSGSNFAIEMSVPSLYYVSPTTGGTLTAGTYYFKIVASDGVGTTIGSSEGSCIVDGVTTTACYIRWSTPTGASFLRVYASTTSGGQNHYFTDTASTYTYTTSTGGTAGSVPSVTTAYVKKLTASGNSWLLGNVGIGTATPNNLLQVYDLIDFDNSYRNTKIGYQAGKNIVAGASYNTFVGYYAGLSSAASSTSVADYNTGLGSYALYSNTAGKQNTGLGYYALYGNTEGSYNTGLGYNALKSNTTGYNNIGVGHWALSSNSTGYHNTGLGSYVLYNNTTGYYNTGLGSSALYYNRTGYSNSVMGYRALYNNTTGYGNSAMGYYALYNLKPTSKAITAFADSATEPGTSTTVTSSGHGQSNGTTVQISGTTNYNGSFVISNVTTNTFDITKVFTVNDATGWWGIDTEGRYNTALGYQAGMSSVTGSGNVFLGYQAGYSETGSDKLYIDNSNTASPLIYGDFSSNILAINGNLGIGTVSPGSYKLYVDAGGSGNAGIGVDGYIKATGSITGTTTLDLAERFPIDPQCQDNNNCPEAGDIVVVKKDNEEQSFHIERSTESYDEKLIGIVSTNPGFILGGGLNESNSRLIALTGRVPVKVSIENGAIEIGAPLTSSQMPGLAMRATRPGMIIGTALQSFQASSSDAIIATSTIITTTATTVETIVSTSTVEADVTESETTTTTASTTEITLPSEVIITTTTVTTTITTIKTTIPGPFISPADGLFIPEGETYTTSTTATSSETSTYTVITSPAQILEQNLGRQAETFTITTTETRQLQSKVMVFINPGFSLGTLDNEGDFISLATTTLATTTDTGTESETTTVLDRFTKAIKLTLQKLGLFIENGVAKVKKLVAGTARLDKIEMVDQSTGEIYCTWIENGQEVMVQGECESSLVSDNASSLGPAAGSGDTSDGGAECTSVYYYYDGDGDGYGYTQGSFQITCVQPDGHVPNNDDCNDDDSSINLGVNEICDDKIDNNCDGIVDNPDICQTETGTEATTTDTTTSTTTVETCDLGHLNLCESETDCQTAGGYWYNEICNTEPETPTCTPTEEICDGLDNDCDGLIDEDLFQQCGSNDVGACSFGTQTCQTGVWSECQGAIEPVEEICDDNIDNNCDGQMDEGCLPPEPEPEPTPEPEPEPEIGE